MLKTIFPIVLTLCAGTASALAQPPQPCAFVKIATVFDDDGDNVLDIFDYITVKTPVGVWYGELRIGASSTNTPARIIFSSEAGFGRRAIAVADLNNDGHADFAVAAPFTSGTDRMGSVKIVSGLDGVLLFNLTGPENCMFGTGLEMVRDQSGDGRPDLAVAYMFVDTDGAVFQRWCAMSGTTFASVTAAPTAYKCGDLSDLDADGEVSDVDLQKAINAVVEEMTDADKNIADVNKDGVIDFADVAEVVFKLGVPLQIGATTTTEAAAVKLPVKAEQLYTMASIGARVPSSATFCVSGGIWRADGNACVAQPAAPIPALPVPCSKVGCVWNGQISFDYWVALLGGLGSLDVNATGLDTTFCAYAVGGTAPLSGGGGLALGYVAAGVAISNYPAPCMWPVMDGSPAAGALVGLGGNFIGPSGLWWPAATAGMFSGIISPWPWGGGGVNVGAGGSGAAGTFPIGSMTLVGPTPTGLTPLTQPGSPANNCP